MALGGGYCSAADVQVHRPHHVISDTSTPTEIQVVGEIQSLSAVVDGRLAAAGFTVPVPASAIQSRDYLRRAVAYGVAALVENQQVAGVGGAPEGENRYWALFEMMIASVEKNTAILKDAPNTGGGGGEPPIESFFTNNPSDDLEAGITGRLEGSAVPRFRMSQNF